MTCTGACNFGDGCNCWRATLAFEFCLNDGGTCTCRYHDLLRQRDRSSLAETVIRLTAERDTLLDAMKLIATGDTCTPTCGRVCGYQCGSESAFAAQTLESLYGKKKV